VWCSLGSIIRAETVTFAVFGDYGSSTPAATQVADLVKSWAPDFIITTGDNIYGDIAVGSPDWELYIGARYGQFMKGRGDGKYPNQTSPVQRFFPSVGNHDTDSGFVLGDSPRPGPAFPAAPAGPALPAVPVGTGGGVGDKPGYIDYFHTDPGEPGRLPEGTHTPRHSYYDFRRGPVHLFALDSDRAQSEPASLVEQQEWLQARLADSDAPWKFVYFHHPAYSSGPHGPHPLMQWPFAQWGVDAVFQGHDHNYERLRVDDVLYFVSGLGGVGAYGFVRDTPGSEFRYSQSNGAMRVVADESNVHFEFIALDPQGDPSGLTIDPHLMSKPIPEPATAAAMTLVIAALVIRRIHRAPPSAAAPRLRGGSFRRSRRTRCENACPDG
jgi:hypothetical protein